MSNLLKVAVTLLILITVCTSLLLGKGIPFKEQLSIYDGLRNTSAIIFAVMGAWIALLYPAQLAKAFGKKNDATTKNDIDQINRLFKPMIYSTLILMIVIVMSLAVPLAKQVQQLHEFKGFFRSISFATISSLTILQLWSLVLTLIPGDTIKDNLDEVQERKRMLERMKPGKNNSN